jgi:biopolymer transport protein ExbB
MRTERRVGKSWVWFTLAVLFFAVLILNTASQLSLAQEGGSEATEAPENFFIWIIHVSGLIGLVILCLSVYFVATVGRMFVELRPQTAMPPEVIAQCEAMLEQRDFKGIFNVVKEDDSFFSRVLVTGITELPNGLSEAREAMERVGDMLTTEMEKKISMMAVLGTLGPMIGLLGTLKGMIAAFSIIARQNTQIKSGEVAGAISESLVLTFEGVGLSVPSIWFFSFFRNRVMFISVTTMTRADEFLRHFAQAARGKPGAQAAPARAKT